jgi:hypothetical protein
MHPTPLHWQQSWSPPDCRHEERNPAGSLVMPCLNSSRAILSCAKQPMVVPELALHSDSPWPVGGKDDEMMDVITTTRMNESAVVAL